MRLLRFLLLSGLSAGLFWLGYFVWWPAIILAPVALALFFVTCRSRRTCTIGALAGGMIAWRPVQDCLTAYGPFGVHLLILWQACTLIPVALSLRWGWLRGLGMWWFFPLVWVGGEYLRMLGPIGFPFCALAVPAHDQLWLIQIADLGGLHLVSAVIAMIGGLLLDLARHQFFSSAPPRTASRTVYFAFGGTATVLSCVVAYGLFRRAQIERSLTPGPVIAVVQPDVPHTDTPENDYDGSQLLGELQAMSEAAARHQPRPQLIVWPEAIGILPLHNPEYFETPFAPSLFPEASAAATPIPPEELSRRWDQMRAELRRRDAAFRDWLRDLGIPILYGEIARLPSTRDGRAVFHLHNSARLIRPDSSAIVERQSKVRLFPGGEYVPGGPEVRRILTRLPGAFGAWIASIPDFQPGLRRERFHLLAPDGASESVGETAFHVSLCSEILFPLNTGSFELRETKTVYISIASEGRYQRNRAQIMTHMIQPFRAIETRTALARSANTGMSGFTSPTGALYAPVTDAAGRMRTGRGFPEKEAIQIFRRRARDFAASPTDPVLQAERAKLQDEIIRLRAEAGVQGFSVARLHHSPHRTVYQSTGDVFAQATLLVLLAATAGAGLSSTLRQ